MKKLNKKLTLAFCVICSTVIVASMTGCGGKEVSDAAVDPVEKKAEGIEVWGEARVKTTEEIVIDFPYTITDVFVQEGQSVKKGDVLLEIDYNDYLQTVSKKEKEISLSGVTASSYNFDTSAMQKEVQRLTNELELKQKYYDNPETDTEYNALILNLEKENMNLNAAKDNLNKNKQLFDAGVISKQEYDIFVKDAETAEKNKQNEEIKIQELKNNRELEITKLKSDIAAENVKINETSKTTQDVNASQKLNADIAKIEKAQMEDRLKKIFIDGNKIICNVEQGIIQTVNCQKGNIMNTTSEFSKIMTILDMNTLYVSADVPEEFIGGVKIGSKAEITPYAARDQILTGEVTGISDMAVKENGETVVKVEIKLTGEHDILKPGFTVDVSIF